MPGYHEPPSKARLIERLRQLGVEIRDDADATEARDAIEEMLASMAVCSRVVIDGKAHCYRFFQMHEAVYGEKWVHRERAARLTSELKEVMK